MKYLNFIILLLLTTALFFTCSEENNQLTIKKGYIVGFDPCTINHNYKIGYIIITEDLKDTLITYSLSDAIYKMPARVLFNPNHTLYKIPESYFQNYRNSPFFSESLRYEYPIDFSYSIANETEMIFYVCTTEIISIAATQVLINSVKKILNL